MVDSLKNRISKEYEDLKKAEKENQIIVEMQDNNIRHWKGSIKGPVSNHYMYIILITLINLS
jgi:ubiquitin-protein ligase